MLPLTGDMPEDALWKRVRNTYEFNQSIDESKMTRNVGLYSSSWKLDYRIYFRTKAEYVKTAPATNILRKDCYTDKTQMCYNHINAGKITLLIFQVLYIYGIIKLVNIFNVRLKTFEYWKFSFLSILLLLAAYSVFSTAKHIKHIILEVNNMSRVKRVLLLWSVFRLLSQYHTMDF